MDTTQEFISMVKSANLPWEWKVRDLVWDDTEKQAGVIIMHGQTIKVAWDNTAVMAFNPDANIIPLPRLDQLAEMAGSFTLTYPGDGWYFEDRINRGFDTAEKVMLARVMAKQYKSWNEREWV